MPKPARMRWPAVVAALAIVVGLGALQALASIAAAPAAQDGSLVRRLSVAGPRVDALDPALPMPEALRILLVRRALAARDLARAAALAERLGPSTDRASFEARIAELRGDAAAAQRGWFDAGDYDELERLVDELERRGDVRGAERLQSRIVARLAQDRTHPNTLAEAWWRLGVLCAALPPRARSPEGTQPYARRAIAAYEEAIALAPLSAKYLISAASQDLNLHDLDGAQRYFERAAEQVPGSVLIPVGYGEVAVRRRDFATARKRLAEARRIDAAEPAVERLARKIPR
jgi:tetratricopeptide (TPR) repeat protein